MELLNWFYWVRRKCRAIKGNKVVSCGRYKTKHLSIQERLQSPNNIQTFAWQRFFSLQFPIRCLMLFWYQMSFHCLRYVQCNHLHNINTLRNLLLSKEQEMASNMFLSTMCVYLRLTLSLPQAIIIAFPNNIDPDESAQWAVSSGSTLFDIQSFNV